MDSIASQHWPELVDESRGLREIGWKVSPPPCRSLIHGAISRANYPSTRRAHTSRTASTASRTRSRALPRSTPDISSSSCIVSWCRTEATTASLTASSSSARPAAERPTLPLPLAAAWRATARTGGRPSCPSRSGSGSPTPSCPLALQRRGCRPRFRATVDCAQGGQSAIRGRPGNRPTRLALEDQHLDCRLAASPFLTSQYDGENRQPSRALAQHSAEQLLAHDSGNRIW